MRMGNHVLVFSVAIDSHTVEQNGRVRHEVPQPADEIVQAGLAKNVGGILRTMQMARQATSELSVSLTLRRHGSTVCFANSIMAQLRSSSALCVCRGTTFEQFQDSWWEQELCKALDDYSPSSWEPTPGYLSFLKGSPVFIHPWSVSEPEHNNAHRCPYVYGWRESCGRGTGWKETRTTLVPVIVFLESPVVYSTMTGGCHAKPKQYSCRFARHSQDIFVDPGSLPC